MATFQYIAGYINLKAVDQFPDIAAWGRYWLDKAQNAEREGSELVVFEVPKIDPLYALWEVAGVLPGDQLPFAGTGVAVSLEFLHELAMPIDDME